MQRIRSFAGFCAVALVAVSGPAVAMQCPTPQKLSRPGVLQETPVQTQEMSAYLGDGNDSGDHAALIIEDLRRRYPDVRNAEVTNYLLTAYCPLVARLNGLSEAEKQARMDRFASQLDRMLAAPTGKPRTKG
jgi:hypothetical protein